MTHPPEIRPFFWVSLFTTKQKETERAKHSIVSSAVCLFVSLAFHHFTQFQLIWIIRASIVKMKKNTAKIQNQVIN